jgi:ribonuclease BN (tRNA processing enzyme)
VKLTVVGSSPAWPNPGGAQSGYLIESRDGRVLLDCGPGVLSRLRQLNGGWPEVDAVVVTHWHLDHWGDLVPWVWGAMVGPARLARKVALWLPPAGEERLRQLGGQLGWEGMWESAFTLAEYADRVPFHATEGLDVTPVRLLHYTLETYGLRVTDGERSISYSGDTGPSHHLVDLARDTDLFVCEATLERGELDGMPRGHLAADEAVAAFAASGARRLLLTHRPEELPLDEGLEQAWDGLEIEL